MIVLKENTFAAACYNMNSIEELEQALQGPADRTDMKEWGIGSSVWREQIQLALKAMKEDASHFSYGY